ncbi:hypothetical protein [Streptomyces sp. NPDC051577]|uniref:hypothetical protein n=1 Tax=Streptomyces sp. NPDC051577 TaxID=3155166 RepID=UPI0034165DBE
MTASELTWMFAGLDIGIMLAMLTSILGNVVDARRELLAAESAQDLAAKWLVTDGWRAVLERRETA